MSMIISPHSENHRCAFYSLKNNYLEHNYKIIIYICLYIYYVIPYHHNLGFAGLLAFSYILCTFLLK